MSFVNLYTQTEYSLLGSNIAIKDLPTKAKEKNYDAVIEQKESKIKG